MRQLNKLQTATLAIGALLLVVGAVMKLFHVDGGPYIFAVGALAYAAMQMLQSYEGSNFTIQRLRRIMLMSDVLLLLTAALMIADDRNPFGLDHYNWLYYIHAKWVASLLLAALIQLYTVYRIDAELKKMKNEE